MQSSSSACMVSAAVAMYNMPGDCREISVLLSDRRI